MINYQNFSNWTGTSVSNPQSVGSDMGQSSSQRAFASIIYKVIASLFS